MNIRPLYARLLVRRFKAKETTKGGIVIPDKAKTKVNRGEVLAMGKGAQNRDGEYMGMDFSVGDIVMFEEYAGKDIKEAGDGIILLEESAILAVVEMTDADFAELEEPEEEEIQEAVATITDMRGMGLSGSGA
jgi:chaperonin GroES